MLVRRLETVDALLAFGRLAAWTLAAVHPLVEADEHRLNPGCEFLEEKIVLISDNKMEPLGMF